MQKKITILCLHLGYGGIEVAITNLANMLIDKYDVEIISQYNIYGKPVYELDSRIKVKFLFEGTSNRKEFFDYLKKFNPNALVISLIISGLIVSIIMILKYTVFINVTFDSVYMEDLVFLQYLF